MRYSSLRFTLFVAVLVVTVGTVSAQNGNVEVFTSRSAFELATGARQLPFPASATVLPLKTEFAGLLDYSCVLSPPGIDLPVNSAAPLANIQSFSDGLICFIGKDWNAGATNINPQPQGPTIVANGQDDFHITFAAPVYAVGFELLTNSLAAETFTLKFADEAEESFNNVVTEPNAFQFVGFVSTNAIAAVDIDTAGGDAQNEGITAVLAAFTVRVDIKPCSEPSPVNLKSNGVVTAAILGSAAVDVSLIDPGTVTLQGLSPKEPGKSGKLLCRIEDVASQDGNCGPDGLPDLVCHFQLGESDQDLTSETWILRARTYSGVDLLGFDTITVIIPPSVDNNDSNGNNGNNGNGNGKPDNPGSGKPDNPGNGVKVPPGQEKDKPGNNGNGNGNSNGGKKP